MSERFPYQITPSTDDERFMLEALKEAWKAYLMNEVPVGAVLVKEGRIVSRGHNQVEMLRDATAHAEMLCMTSGAGALDNWRLTDATLYCTMSRVACALGLCSCLVWTDWSGELLTFDTVPTVAGSTSSHRNIPHIASK